jgi:hypothetical protein
MPGQVIVAMPFAAMELFAGFFDWIDVHYDRREVLKMMGLLWAYFVNSCSPI